MTTYGSTTLQAALGVDPASTRPLRKAAKSALHRELTEKRLVELKSRMSAGGLREAVVRALLFAGMDRAAVDERGFEAVRRIRQALNDAPLPAFKATVREQFYLLLIDTEAALAAIPSMTPEDLDTRQKAFDLVRQVLTARGEPSARDQARIQRVGQLFRVDGQLPATGNLAIASDKRATPHAKAS